MQQIVFVDTEVGIADRKIHDIGACKDNYTLHTGKVEELIDFIKDCRFICGHNLIHHDLKYLASAIEGEIDSQPIDTLYLSPLLFPKRPYHSLLKDDKLQVDELNNPVNDCKKAQILFNDEVKAFQELPETLQHIFYNLLKEIPEFKGFFEYLRYNPFRGLLSLFKRNESEIKEFFQGRICANAPVDLMIKSYLVELAYALALIHADDCQSIIPPWTLKNYPKIYNLISLLKNKPCEQECPYCREKLNALSALHKYFGYESFRSYNGEPLQERAVQAAIEGKSILVVFPTGGGKSITFQLPAFMAGDNAHGLTVVISPLQSLMKDQVDNLKDLGITGAVTVNGLLSPVERADAYQRISDGSASILYIAPEMLRSKTIEKMLMSRNVVRFVIDEAHCFSSWGQDFRIDYLYIGEFIRKLQKNKSNGQTIAVSCFTATAKQKVISDIRDYFKNELQLDLEIFASNAARENLTYNVLYKETEEDKYIELRNLIERKDCPTIIYVSRTQRAVDLACKLTADGFPAKAFHGKMPAREKINHQEAFISNEVRIIVATSAFGMGVDKKDIKLVIHYDISDSLENYVQESGRAGRDNRIQAECYVLYNDTDLDKHFILLNQTKLSISEIQQVWKAIKRMTGNRKRICCSALEIARMAGWDNSVSEIETRVKTAIAALENAGYIKRGNNMPRVYATGIKANNMEEATKRINRSTLFEDEKQQQSAKRIIKSLISSRCIAEAGNDDAESRVDYLADTLAIPKAEVITVINKMREDGLLADTQDMSAYIQKDDTQRRTFLILERFARLEEFLLSHICENEINEFNLKELNARADSQGIASANVKNLRTILYFLTIKHYIQKEEYKGTSNVKLATILPKKTMMEKFRRRINICKFIVEEFYSKIQELSNIQTTADSPHLQDQPVSFSLVGLYNKYRTRANGTKEISQNDVQDALLYLSTIGAIGLEGGFLVLYNGMEINRLQMDNRIRYKKEDYTALSEFYTQKIQQIHIVGEFANMMVKDYHSALQFVNDYFQMDFRKFISTYFKGERAEKLNRNMTSQRYQKLFGCLSVQQKRIIDDDESKHIVVVAGPGSGKTRVLVHKLAAMLTLEDVKHEQLLMVTFSRAAATEFKIRLKELIGNAANFVEIKTFHSYCFDLLGRIGSLNESEEVVKKAVKMIREGEVEPERVAKSVLVIDEAQDMDKDEFDLICALMEVNDGMRVIAVGDDDQNIYEFRGSDSRYMRSLVTDYEAQMYELVENYRSKEHIVRFSNAFAHLLSNRLKNKEITAVSHEPGVVALTRHQFPYLEETLTEALCLNPIKGSSCLMTATNDEAFRILGLLTKKGIHAKLIQSNDGFSLYNLAEVRYFLRKLTPQAASNNAPVHQSPVISDKEWNDAIESLTQVYADSTCLENCLQMLTAFEKTSNRKYRSDLIEFIKESNFEDFYQEEQGAIYVSTIHKSKGREFDNVYLLLNHLQIQNDEALRKLYVAMTRAKNELYIHYVQTPVIDRVRPSFVTFQTDEREHPASEEIALQLTHKDVFLDFFKDKKNKILQLHSGCQLTLHHDVFYATIHNEVCPVAKLSKTCCNRLVELFRKGYAPFRAEVRFVVAWKKEEDATETAVLLPNVYFRVRV